MHHHIAWQILQQIVVNISIVVIVIIAAHFGLEVLRGIGAYCCIDPWIVKIIRKHRAIFAVSPAQSVTRHACVNDEQDE